MEAIGQSEIRIRIARDNYWWNTPNAEIAEAKHPRRVYFKPFCLLALNFNIQRATILLGPRRVGKTVIVKQLVHEAISKGFDRNAILYASIDTPIYSGMSLEKFLDHFPANAPNEQRIVIFDEIQYLRDWEIHLKDLVDNYKNIKFIALGSAAAALKLKSKESGAGRFSEFMLPPLTFYEFLDFIGEDENLISVQSVGQQFNYAAKDLDKLNEKFIEYLNYGGYPEVVFNDVVRNNPEQFIRNDIIDKVLLKDLPSLYGISEIQQLNKLFMFLAYNAGNEASLENIAQKSGLAKPTIKRYIEYLESAFLILKLSTVDDNCKTMKRARNFKIYLNNPSMRAALFAPVSKDQPDRIGHLAESAIFSQWQHTTNFRQLRYARWRNEGEVDIVYLDNTTAKPIWIGEISWSDEIKDKYGATTKAVTTMLKNHKSIVNAFFTTKTISSAAQIEGRKVAIVPSALYCYTVGRNITTNLATAAQQITETKS
jgi:predicted AAA+ superfamily ATPase